MKNSWKTIEFWAAMIGQVTGILVLAGVLTPEAGSGIAEAVTVIIGGILTLGSIFGFIKAEATRKQLAAGLMLAKLEAQPEGEAKVASSAAVDALIKQL